MTLLRSLVWLRALCIIAAAAISFGAPAYGIDRIGANIESAELFELPDGSLPIICFGDGAEHQTAIEHNCGQCCLTLLNHLAAPDSGFDIVRLDWTQSAFISIPSLTVRHLPLADHHQRGPPSA